MTLDCTRIDKHFTPSEQEMKVSLLNKLVMTFTLKKGIYLPYNFFYTCNTVEVDFLNLGTNGITESVTCGKGKNNRLTVAVPVHSGRRALT